MQDRVIAYRGKNRKSYGSKNCSHNMTRYERGNDSGVPEREINKIKRSTNPLEPMSIGAWNIRGLCQDRKKSDIKRFVRNQKLSIFGLLETMVR